MVFCVLRIDQHEDRPSRMATVDLLAAMDWVISKTPDRAGSSR